MDRRRKLMLSSKICIMNRIISLPFPVDPTDFIGVCNSKQACYWKCQRQWSFIQNQQILVSLKSLFAWICNQIDLVTGYGSAAEILTMSKVIMTAMRHKTTAYCKPKLFTGILFIRFFHTCSKCCRKTQTIFWICIVYKQVQWAQFTLQPSSGTIHFHCCKTGSTPGVFY